MQPEDMLVAKPGQLREQPVLGSFACNSATHQHAAEVIKKL